MAKRPRVSAGDQTTTIQLLGPRVAAAIEAFLRRRGLRYAIQAAAEYRAVLKATTLTRAARALTLQKADSDDIERVMLRLSFEDWEEVVELLEGPLRDVYRSSGASGVRDLVSASDDAFNALNEAARSYAERHAAELVTQISETTRESLRDLVADAFESGMTPGVLASSIREAYEFSDARARTIARTELADAHVEGTLQGWRESGVVSGKRSILGSEHDTDDVCNDNQEAGVIPLEAAFPSGDEGPPYHPNCVCDVLAEVE